ncbi:hypothetical protein ILUMI_11215 [Ignelater luminosus]|uniref:Transposase n=1 Tax=Ignelater luminosus TaxID=2038154 RepID=A0A8K0D2J9_IGNLU|nr:hypothetical protein ILUMI_11215 [Ignelater luminosus]
MASHALEIRKRIIYKYQENINASYAHIARELKLSRKRVRDVIIRFNERLTYEKQDGSGRKNGLLDKELEKKVGGAYKVNPSVSLRRMAQRFKTSRTTVQKIKRNNNLKTFKAVKVSNRNAIQNQTAKTRARKLYNEFLGILMDVL